MPKLPPFTVKPGRRVRLGKFDPADTAGWRDRARAEAAMPALLGKLRSLSERLYADRRFAVLIVLQGMDTAGKDGTIRHVMDGLSPLGTRVVAFKVPTEEERDHDFLWRVHKETPRRGEFVIFNRSHYEDVLVARVANLAPKKVWKRRYGMINDFEAMLAGNRTIILKFFLHLSKNEQKRRLRARLKDPAKNWKFQPGDLKARTRWDDYQAAYEDALTRCNSEAAPWHIVPADEKWVRNGVIAERLVARLESLDLRYPKPEIAPGKVRIV